MRASDPRRSLLVLVAILWTCAVAPLEAQLRRRSVAHPSPFQIGYVELAVSYTLSEASLAEVRVNEDVLADLGFRLVGDRLVADPVPAAGFHVYIGDQKARVRDDGTFTVLPVPANVTTGEVVGRNGSPRTTFAVHDVLVAGGSKPGVITVELILTDEPNLMNDWDVLEDSSAHAGHQHGITEHAQVCPSAAPCRVDTKCEQIPDQCCLDYNGMCANGERHFARPGQDCSLRFLQFLGST